jgi:hypothetical protein
LNEKEKLFAAFREMERQMRDANFDLDRELHPDSIERSWSQLMMLFQVSLVVCHYALCPRLEPLCVGSGGMVFIITSVMEWQRIDADPDLD